MSIKVALRFLAAKLKRRERESSRCWRKGVILLIGLETSVSPPVLWEGAASASRRARHVATPDDGPPAPSGRGRRTGTGQDPARLDSAPLTSHRGPFSGSSPWFFFLVVGGGLFDCLLFGLGCFFPSSWTEILVQVLLLTNILRINKRVVQRLDTPLTSPKTLGLYRFALDRVLRSNMFRKHWGCRGKSVPHTGSPVLSSDRRHPLSSGSLNQGYTLTLV